MKNEFCYISNVMRAQQAAPAALVGGRTEDLTVTQKPWTLVLRFRLYPYCLVR